MHDAYQQYIFKSRYARYLPEVRRREHWGETIERYLSFIAGHLEKKHNYKIAPSLRKQLFEGIYNMDIMPSMRALMTAGRALERDNTAGYNCAYLPVDDIRSFDEAMFILMCGTGVGFSVERQYVNQLPEIPEVLERSNTVIVVKDSKEGWAKALRLLITVLYSGDIPTWDLSKLRPAGAPLKTFGGRSSGPEPLDDLFKYVVSVFKNAVDRKLTSLECHDIMCKIAECIVVGGVRRSAMISLSNLSDDRMRNAKSGEWWHAQGQRALSNNSAVYDERPDVGIFMEEWLSLYQSKSGERGIFSREASQKVAARSGRRDSNHQFGTNPCSEIILRPYQFCNLTEVICRADDTEQTIANKCRLAGILGTFQSTLTYFPYLRKAWTTNTEEERLLGVSMTGIYDCPLINNYNDPELPARLERLRDTVVATNKEFADKIGIPNSTACTAVKPSGTVSQLTDASSGIHPRHSEYYIRRIRGDNKDPLTQYLKTINVPHEPDVTKPDSTTVFEFIKTAPPGSKVRDDITALDHLNLWLMFQRHWCEHKPSVTVSVREHEWPIVGSWIWEHFDEVSGISFLPHDGGSYRQAPYEEISQQQYHQLYQAHQIYNNPVIDWNNFSESEDNVEGTQTLACVAQSCEL